MGGEILTYQDLRRIIDQPAEGSSVFVCGQHCSAEIDLTCNRVGRTATAPVDILSSLVFDIPEEQTERVILYPNHIEKEHRISEAVEATSVWFAPTELPAIVVMWKFSNCASTARLVQITCRVEYNLNYISKFRKYPNDTAIVEGSRLSVFDSQYSELQAVTATSSEWTHCSVERNDIIGPDQKRIEQPSLVKGVFSCMLTIPPGAGKDFTVVISGSDKPGKAEQTVEDILSDPQACFDQTYSYWAHLTEGLSIQTPSTELDEFFLHSKLWGWKNSRMVPLGEPFTLQEHCAELVALNASPDYHGLFANDNAQSIWELGSLGEDFYPILRNTLEVLYRFGTPESVEVDPIDATGKPWLSPLRIGEKPEWVIGACSLILWSGKYHAELWPRIQEILARYPENDLDGDWLDDWSCSTYPEQPDPGIYSHEMIYASAFWAKAFELAGEAGVLVGDSEQAKEYRKVATRIAAAIEAKFGTDFGYASWLSEDHRQHPHKGHNMALPVHYGLASRERAEKVIQTLLSPPMWVPEGPLVADPSFPMAGGKHVWNFMRWAFVHGMFIYGSIEKATSLMLAWTEQEKNLDFQAPEGFPTITGATGKGYTWSAGAVMRTVLFGLFGIELLGRGLLIRPNLPKGWETISLAGLSYRGAVYHIHVIRSDQGGMTIDGRIVNDDVLPADLPAGVHQVEVRVKSTKVQ